MYSDHQEAPTNHIRCLQHMKSYGFEIEEQRIVDWVKPEIDCLTLVVKR